MRKTKLVEKLLAKILGGDLEVKIKPPDLIIERNGRVYIIRYLIGKEASFGLNEINGEVIKRFIETYSSILEKLPEGSEIKLVKQRVDLNNILSRISNEMMNLKAILDVIEEPHVKQKTLVKLKTLESLYELIIRGTGITRLTLIIKLRSSGTTINEAKQVVSALTNIVKNIMQYELGIKIYEASRRDIVKILRYEIGLDNQLPIKNIVLDNYRVASLAPIPINKKPSIEEQEGIPIGVDLESRWPVIIPFKQLNKHMIVIGPTGRGKTTLLASLIEGIVSMSSIKVFAIDYKGDLVKLLKPALLDIVEPQNYPISILQKPSFIDVIEWSLYVSDVLSNILGIEQNYITKILAKIYRIDIKKETIKKILLDPDLSILSSVIELLTSKSDYEKIRRIVDENVVFDVSGYGTSYQNTYTGLLLGIYKKIVLSDKKNIQRIVIIDEAWRISRLKLLLELIKEGRSRNLGVVLATQNPSDLPREIIENVHLIVIFGSPNEDYRESIRKILGVPRDIVSKLSYLNVGEAILLNALDPHPIFVRIRPPRMLYEKKVSSHHLF